MGRLSLSARFLALRRRPRAPQALPWPPQAGLTLVELLLASVVFSLIVAAAATAIVANVRTANRSEAIQRLREHWGRVSYFLDTEIAEGDTASSTAGCSGVSNLAFSMVIPVNPPLSSGPSTAKIDYYNKNGGVWRCGPPVGRNGRLVFSLSGTSLVTTDSLLVDGASLSANISNNREPIYTLSLTDVTGVQYSQTSSTRSSIRTF